MVISSILTPFKNYPFLASPFHRFGFLFSLFVLCQCITSLSPFTPPQVTLVILIYIQLSFICFIATCFLLPLSSFPSPHLHFRILFCCFLCLSYSLLSLHPRLLLSTTPSFTPPTVTTPPSSPDKATRPSYAHTSGVALAVAPGLRAATLFICLLISPASSSPFSLLRPLPLPLPTTLSHCEARVYTTPSPILTKARSPLRSEASS